MERRAGSGPAKGRALPHRDEPRMDASSPSERAPPPTTTASPLPLLAHAAIFATRRKPRPDRPPGQTRQVSGAPNAIIVAGPLDSMSGSAVARSPQTGHRILFLRRAVSAGAPALELIPSLPRAVKQWNSDRHRSRTLHGIGSRPGGRLMSPLKVTAPFRPQARKRSGRGRRVRGIISSFRTFHALASCETLNINSDCGIKIDWRSRARSPPCAATAAFASRGAIQMAISIFKIVAGAGDWGSPLAEEKFDTLDEAQAAARG